MIDVARILCPMDLSDFSRRALAHAAALARWYGADLTAVHVQARPVRPLLWGEDAVSITLESLAETPASQAALRTMVEEATGRPDVTVLFREGAVVQEIVRAAADLHSGLIVMGTHGAGGFERLMLGSVTEKVLRKAPCPVLTVPRRLTESLDVPRVTFRTIVCGLDFSPASVRALTYALSLAQESQGRVILAHVFEGLAPEHAAALAAKFDVADYIRVLEAAGVERMAGLIPAAARAWCDPEFVVVHGKPYRELLRVAESRGADLLVLGTHGHGPIDLPLFGSTSGHVLRQALCPVLTVPLDPRAARAVA